MRAVSVDDAPAPAFGLAERLTPGEGPWHQHRRHQLLYAASGRLTLELDDAAWTLPPQRAAWIRSNTLHRVCLTRPVELRAVYLSPEFCPALNTDARVFAIDELTRQLLLASVRFGPARDPDDPLANDLLRTLAGLAHEHAARVAAGARRARRAHHARRWPQGRAHRQRRVGLRRAPA